MRNEINDGYEESSLVFTRSTFERLRETPLSRDYFQASVQCLPSPSINRFSSRRSWIGSSSAKLSMKEICTVGSFRLTGSKCSKVRIIMENSFHAARAYRLQTAWQFLFHFQNILFLSTTLYINDFWKTVREISKLSISITGSIEKSFFFLE